MKVEAIIAMLMATAIMQTAQTAAVGPNPRLTTMHGESLVLAATNPGRLAFAVIRPGSLVLRSTRAPGEPATVAYEEGRDYVVDYEAGTIARTADSRIPDYAKHPMNGAKDFDQTKFGDFSNRSYFVWADYEAVGAHPLAAPNDQPQFLENALRKLEAGGPFLIATYGDSITAGGEASTPGTRFANRYADFLRAKFPKAEITLRDASIPGYTSREGVAWFDKKLGTVTGPDLVLIGFGMNDHNQGSVGGIEPEAFKANLEKLVALTRAHSEGVDIVLFSAFPPNEDWHWGTHRMNTYADLTRDVATATGCAFADVFGTWTEVLKRKDQSSLLNNNINHPNDFGHWLYLQALEATTPYVR